MQIPLGLYIVLATFLGLDVQKKQKKKKKKKKKKKHFF
jgi:hypothetical protein